MKMLLKKGGAWPESLLFNNVILFTEIQNFKIVCVLVKTS